jgi:predicted ester cyclase
MMSDNDGAAKPNHSPLRKSGGKPEGAPAEKVLQVERRDYVDLAPTDRPRAQSMRGFDPIYTDIVDYIVRCTHRIWDERNIGLIYTHYTHNAIIYNSLGAIYSREDIVRDTIQRLASFPERRGMATQVIWRGNDVDGFYTSHLVTGSGRHSQYGHFGKPTGRSFVSRTVADCMILENRIFREWIATDTMALVRQLGLDPNPIAEKMARDLFGKGQTAVDIGENRRMIGQYPPDWTADTSLAHSDSEAHLLTWLHEAFNKRMLGVLKDVYAPNVQYHGTNMRELVGRAAVLQQVLRTLATMPDLIFMPQHICSVPCEEGGEKIALRWIIDGHHLGYGFLGEPTGYRLCVLGMSHFHVVNGLVREEWVVFDELSMLAQLKLGALTAGQELPIRT